MAQEIAKDIQGNDVIQFGPYGNQDATVTFDFISDTSDRIKTVKLGYDSIINGIGFDIIDQSGKTETKYFGSDGQEEHTIHLLDEEYITRISGYSGKTNGVYRVVAQMMIHTNVAPSGYGPFGRMAGCTHIEPFTTPKQIRGRIIGFLGAGESFIASIGAYMRED